MRVAPRALLALLVCGCSLDPMGLPMGAAVDAGARMDAGAATGDAGEATDAGPRPTDAGAIDAGVEPGEDAGGLLDAGAPDAGAPDAGAPDAGAPDAGPPRCSAIFTGGTVTTVCSSHPPGFCRIWAFLDGDSCNDFCGSYGRSCDGAFRDEAGGCSSTQSRSCSWGMTDAICICSR